MRVHFINEICLFVFRIMDLSIACQRGRNWVKVHKNEVLIGEKSDANILLIGDSIMAHLDRYPCIEEYTIGRPILNFCSRGDKIQHLIWKIKNNIIPKHIRSIIVHIGTNNLSNNTEKEICDGLGRVVGLVMGRQGALSKVHLVGLIPREDPTHPFRQKIMNINTELEKRFEGWEVFIKPPSNLLSENGELASQFYHDNLHLNELGMELFFQTVTNYLNFPYKFVKKRMRTRRELNAIKALPKIKTIEWFDYRQFKVLLF